MTSQASASDRAFAQLHPALQRWIWQQGWPGLRPIQADAIPLILARDRDVVLAAPTAGGKTEAAFLPILSDLAQQDGAGLRCLAIAPLRALITDQAGRLESVCEAVGLRLQPWHGDVVKGKAGFWKRPTDVLMTTPESLEAMLMRRGPELSRLAAGLRYIVVDELHAFVGTDRGAQLASQLQRIQQMAGKVVPRIGLSATLGDMSVATKFLRPDGAMPCSVVTSTGHGGELRLRLRVVYQPGEPGVAASMVTLPEALAAQLRDLPMMEQTGELPTPPKPGEMQDTEDSPGDRYLTAIGRVSDHLFKSLRGGSHLVFANARNQVEVVADRLRERCDRLGVPNEFYPHHGSLSKDLRSFVEERLRAGTPPTTAVCTSTLEMGIDLGEVDTVAQIGPPPSVSSLKQRIGRSGRRADQAQTLRQYQILPSIDASSSALDWLRLPLIRSIACIELMLEGRFEPPVAGDFHLSTLVQQILSVIVQHSGISTARLHHLLIERGAFGLVDRQLLLDVLRALHASQCIEQAPDGTLLLGPQGEVLTNHYSFYASFATPEQFVLVAEGRRLGTISTDEPLVPDQLIVFGGRRWQIVAIHERDRIVQLRPSHGGEPPRFAGGGIGQHALVHERMRQILQSSGMPRYLDPAAMTALNAGREAYGVLGLALRPAFPEGTGTYLGHWAGSRAGNTLRLTLSQFGIEATSEGPFLWLDGFDVAEVGNTFVDVLERWPVDPMELACRVPILIEGKFDSLLSRDVLAVGYAKRHIDLAGARSVAEQFASAL